MTRIPRHTRTVPPEWPQLTAAADDILSQYMPEGTYLPRLPLMRLYRHVNRLDNEALEASTYYALGEIMCGMAELLRQPAIRQDVALAAASDLLAWAIKARPHTIPQHQPFVPIVRDLAPHTMERPMHTVACAALERLPLPRRTLANMLSSTAMYRRVRVHDPAKSPSRLMAHALAIEDTRNMPLAARQISHNSLSGAVAICATLLTGANPAIGPEPAQLAQPITPESIAVLKRQSKLAVTTAGLRMDEFNDGAGWEGSGETLTFDTTTLTTAPPPLRDRIGKTPYHLHESRLTCPAVQADGLARYVAGTLLPDILLTARTLVPTKVFPAAA